MLAFSVREALRQAAAAFGPAGLSRRPALPGHAGGGLLGRRAARAQSPPRAATEQTRPYAAGPAPDGLQGAPDVSDGRARTAARQVRRELAPRGRALRAAPPGRARHGGRGARSCPARAGAKMVVAADATWGTIGGGNLEARRSRGRGPCSTPRPSSRAASRCASAKGPVEHGQQCCGGEVSLLLEPLRGRARRSRSSASGTSASSWPASWPARTSSCTSSTRAPPARAATAAALTDAVARIHVHHAPVPELVLGQVPQARTSSS